MKINRSVREVRRIDPDGKCEKARIIYVVSGCDDAGSAVDAVRQQAPERIGSARQRTIEITASPGGGVFEVAADYSCGEVPEYHKKRERKDGDRSWRFIANTVSVMKNSSLGTILSMNIAGESDLYPGSRINWNGKNGYDSACGSMRVLEPHFTEICRATFSASKINTAYKRKLISIVGKVNDSDFHHWKPGEVLLESVTQSEPYTNRSGAELCDLVFEFAIRPNGQRACCGHYLDVSGWDHLWAVSEKNPGLVAEAVHSLYVSRIYERCSFNILEI